MSKKKKLFQYDYKLLFDKFTLGMNQALQKMSIVEKATNRNTEDMVKIRENLNVEWSAAHPEFVDIIKHLDSCGLSQYPQYLYDFQSKHTLINDLLQLSLDQYSFLVNDLLPMGSQINFLILPGEQIVHKLILFI